MGIDAPAHYPHGTEEDIRDKLRPLKVIRWRQEGNRLIGETEVGEVVNIIPTDVIMTGVDEKNLPVFEKVL